MKRQLFILTLLTTLFSVYCQAQGIATWIEKSHDFGSFKEETGKVSCDLRFVNTGDSAIRITNVRPTCGCTASSHTAHDIMPGDTATVTLTYNPKGRPGRFDKDAYVYTTGKPHRNRIKIKGNVIGAPSTISEKFPVSAGALKLEGRIIPFGEIFKGKARTQFIGAYNQSEDTLTVTFSDVPAHLQADIVPNIIPPGEQATITVTCHSSRSNQWGLLENSFSIETMPASGHSPNPVAGIVDIDAIAIILEDFSKLDDKERANAPVAELSETKVNFGKISRKETQAVREFKITNTGKSKLLLRRIYTLDKGIEISCKRKDIKPGKSAKVTVKVTPGKEDKLLNAKVTVITNDPANPQQQVRLVGEIIE